MGGVSTASFRTMMIVAAISSAPPAKADPSRPRTSTTHDLPAPSPVRDYRFFGGAPNELEVLSTAGVGLNRALMDAYLQGLSQHVPDPVEPFTRVAWQIWWTFNTSLWPHELGHWARADQAGARFVFDGYGFPFPTTRMEAGQGLSPEEDTSTSVGGFEVNHLMLRQTHTEFHDRGFSHADSLVHAFIQEFYFAMYAFLFAYADPSDPTTWTDTYGDPVESVLLVHRGYTGRDALLANGEVDPDLESLYGQTLLVNLAAMLADPLFYQSALAFAGDMDVDYGRTRPWLFGDDDLGWMYSTRFNQGALGWELYLTNYLHLCRRLYVVSLKYGRPYRNYGLRLSIPSAVSVSSLRLGVEADVFEQARFGLGGGAWMTADVALGRGFTALLKGGYKSEGYLVGRRLGASPLLMAGLGYTFEP